MVTGKEPHHTPDNIPADFRANSASEFEENLCVLFYSGKI